MNYDAVAQAVAAVLTTATIVTTGPNPRWVAGDDGGGKPGTWSA
jgi:hypothetical protein